MKTELVNFINDLPQEVHIFNLSLDEGLYVFVDLDEKGNLIDSSKGIFEKNTEMSPFFYKCLARKSNSSMPTSNKRYNQSFEIGSPFGIGFKKDILFEKQDTKTGKKKGYSVPIINEKIGAYFQVAEEFLNSEKPEHLNYFSIFSQFCKKQLITFSKQLFSDHNKVKAIFIFLDKVQEKDFQETHGKYLSERAVFNDPKSAIGLNDKKYQVSDILNGFGIKKMFLEHKTAPFNLNMLINNDEAIKIWKFFELIRNKVLPNPCPIFIDKKELNEKVIALVHEDNRLNYSKIIKTLFESYSKDIGNYYLLFFQFISQKGFRIIDLDFVPSFKYELNNMKIVEIFPGGDRQEKKVENVFDFEDIVVSKIFDYVLVSKCNNSKSVRYFTDFNDRKNSDVKFIKEFLKRQSKNIDSIIIRVLKYRIAFYDYIYKSKHESIQDLMFHEIMLGGILDDIRLDEYKNKKHSNCYSIREKLNIWFSLYEYFKKNFKLQKEKIMASKIPEHLEMMQNLIIGKKTLKEDDEFAFATGQVLYYLLDKSESSDKSYSRLEPFLQKTNCLELQKTISNTFNAYKHKNFSNNFKKPFAEVMDYETNKNIKELMPSILAGFFSDNSLFSTKVEDNNNVEEQNFN